MLQTHPFLVVLPMKGVWDNDLRSGEHHPSCAGTAEAGTAIPEPPEPLLPPGPGWPLSCCCARGLGWDRLISAV